MWLWLSRGAGGQTRESQALSKYSITRQLLCAALTNMPPPRDELTADSDQPNFQHLTEPPPNGTVVWLRDELGERGFVTGKVVNIADGRLLVSQEGVDHVRHVPLSEVFAHSHESADDISNLPHQHEPALLENLRSRFGRGSIYTSAGTRVLISLNPNQPLPREYGEDVMREYKRGLSRGAMRRPHLYAVGEAAFSSAVRHGASASVIVSGESGAGKTEASKHLLRYLSWRGGAIPTGYGGSRGGSSGGSANLTPAADDLGVAGRVLHSTPIFEAFGNAATSRNHNSSRFGKHMELLLTPEGSVTGARVRTYLLERTRVATAPPPGERNFHIFYYLAAAGRLPGGRDASQYRTLRGSGASYDHGGDGRRLDFGAFGSARPGARGDAPSSGQRERERELSALAELEAALSHLFVPPEAQKALWELLGALMILAEVDFQTDDDGGATASSASASALAAAEDALGCPGLGELLTTQTMKSPRGGSTYTMHVDARRAAAARDTICAELYRCVFEALVARINAVLSGTRADVPGMRPPVVATATGGGSSILPPMGAMAGSMASTTPPPPPPDGSLHPAAAPAPIAVARAEKKKKKKTSAESTGPIQKKPPQRQKPKRAAPSQPPPIEPPSLHMPRSPPSSPPPSPPAQPKEEPFFGSSSSLPSRLSIGLLDLFGFESFEHNSFEQMCINYANEALQHFFIQCTFQAEELLHLEEGVAWQPSWYPDNRDVLGGHLLARPSWHAPARTLLLARPSWHAPPGQGRIIKPPPRPTHDLCP